MHLNPLVVPVHAPDRYVLPVHARLVHALQANALVVPLHCPDRYSCAAHCSDHATNTKGKAHTAAC